MIVKLAMLGTVVLVEITQRRGVTNVFFVFVIQPFLFFSQGNWKYGITFWRFSLWVSFKGFLLFWLLLGDAK